MRVASATDLSSLATADPTPRPVILRIMPAPAIPFAIAIAGGSGSGKTTLTRALVAAFGEQRCALLDHDSYYRDLSHLPPEQRAGTNFDHPAALDNELLLMHLRALRDGEPVYKPNYNFATHTRRHDQTPVEPRPLILAEGILLLSVPELADAFQLRVFVDAPPDIRALRRLQRDIVERGRTVEVVVPAVPRVGAADARGVRRAGARRCRPGGLLATAAAGLGGADAGGAGRRAPQLQLA